MGIAPFMYCWKDGWCRFQGFSLLSKFMLQRIFHTPLLRGILLEYGSKLQCMRFWLQAPYSMYTCHYEFYEKNDNTGHMFCLY